MVNCAFKIPLLRKAGGLKTACLLLFLGYAHVSAYGQQTPSVRTVPTVPPSPGFPLIIYEQMEQKSDSESSAKKAILSTLPASLTSNLERGVLQALRGAQLLKDGKNQEADIEFQNSLKLLPKESQLVPLVQIMSIEATLSKTKSTLAMQKLKTIVAQHRMLTEWKPEQYALMLRILVAAKADRLIAKTWGDYEVHVRPAHRKEELDRLLADYLEPRLKTAQKEWVTVVESMASLYPYTEGSRWAFQKLQSLDCSRIPPKARYVPSLSYLSRLASNAVLDDGLRQYVYFASMGPVRQGNGDTKILENPERITFLIQARLYREASELAEQELAYAPSSTTPQGRVKRAKALSQLGQIQVRMNDWSSAARTYSQFLEEFSEQFDYRYALENLADSLVRLRSHKAAAKIYGRLATSSAADPVLHWHHFWNTYLDGNYTAALELLDRPGYVPQRDRGIEGGLDYWRAKIYEKLGRKQQADELFKKILSSNGDAYYAILIQALRPTMVETRAKTDSPKTYDEGQEVQDELSTRESFAAKLLTNGANTTNPDDQPLGNRLDIGTARFLQKWGDYRDAKRIVRTLPWSNVVGSKLFTEVADLAFSLGDFGYGLKAAGLPDSPFKAVPSAVADLVEHMAKNNSDWRYVYPLAYERLVLKYADEAKVDPFLILSLMRAESVYDPDARSIVGAQGLMQLMPFTAIRTARVMNDANFELKNLHTPEVNIGYGAFYVRKLYDYYGGNILLTVASYNAGPIATDRWVSTFSNLEMDELVETMSFKETRRYVKTVLRNFNQYKRIYSTKPALTNLPRIPQLPTNQDIF